MCLIRPRQLCCLGSSVSRESASVAACRGFESHLSSSFSLGTEQFRLYYCLALIRSDSSHVMYNECYYLLPCMQRP